MTANGLTANQQYYFAIISMDELQPSPLSNVPTGQTQDSIAPAQIVDLTAAAPSIPQAVTIAQSSGEAPPNGNLQAIDNNPNTYWSTPLRPWFQVDFIDLDMGSTQTVNGITLTARADTSAYFPEDLQIEVGTSLSSEPESSRDLRDGWEIAVMAHFGRALGFLTIAN